MKTFVAVVILIAGAIAFGCDPSKLSIFSMCSLPGNTVIAAGLLLIGGSLWVD